MKNAIDTYIVSELYIMQEMERRIVVYRTLSLNSIYIELASINEIEECLKPIEFKLAFVKERKKFGIADFQFML